MIDNVRFHYKSGPIITYYKDAQRCEVPYSSIKEIWHNLTRKRIERWKYKAFGNLIGLAVSVAQGQSGCLFVWNTDTNKIVHYSDSSYCEDFLIYGEKVISLCMVSNFVTPYHIQLWLCELGTKNICETGKRLYSLKPVSFDDGTFSMDYDRKLLMLNGKELDVVIGNNNYIYSDNIDCVELQIPNPNFDYLYKKWDGQFTPGRGALRGMIT